MAATDDKLMITDEKATVLLVTLWLLAILSLLAIGIGFRTSIDLKLVSYQVDKLKAYEFAKAGIAKVISELEKDESLTDTLWQCGITLKYNETFDGKFRNIRVGEGYFSISYIEDLQGKININTASKDILKNLHSRITDEVADNIIAWRGGGGAGGDYSDKKYECKKAPFDIIDELLLIPGIVEEGEMGIEGSITVYGPKEGLKININTAGQRVLEALGLGEHAQKIIDARAGTDGDINRQEDKAVFSGLDELANFLQSAKGGSIDPQDLGNLNLGNWAVFNSGYFKIRSVGVGSKVKKTITCVVNRDSSNKTEIISWVED